MSNQFPSAADHLAEAHVRLTRAAERLTRVTDGRKATLSPSGEKFRNAREMLAGIPTRAFPVCAHCSGPIKLGGVPDDLANWFHDCCWNAANGRPR